MWTRVPVSVAYRDFDIVITFPIFWFVLIFGTFFQLPIEKALQAWHNQDKIFSETENDIDAEIIQKYIKE
jgi:hypothetical protein